MHSFVLRTATRLLLPLLLLFSVYLLVIGHDEPGGGFISGLVAASAFILHSLAYGVAETRSVLRLRLRTLIGLGLLIMLISGVIPMLDGGAFLQAIWGTIPLFNFKFGTPTLFDIGVAAVVVGITLLIILTLAEEQ